MHDEEEIDPMFYEVDAMQPSSGGPKDQCSISFVNTHCKLSSHLCANKK